MLDHNVYRCFVIMIAVSQTASLLEMPKAKPWRDNPGLLHVTDRTFQSLYDHHRKAENLSVFGGDIDAWQRQHFFGYRDQMADSDWVTIDELLQALKVILGGQATSEFTAQINTRILDLSGGEEVGPPFISSPGVADDHVSFALPVN